MKFYYGSVSNDPPEGFSKYNSTDTIEESFVAIFAESTDQAARLLEDQWNQIRGIILTPGDHFNSTRINSQLSHLTLSSGMIPEAKAIATCFLKQKVGTSEDVSAKTDLADMLPMSVFELNTDLQIVYANEYAARQFGVTTERINQGVSALDMLVSKDHPKALSNLEEWLATKEKIKVNEYTGIKYDGSPFPMLLYISAIKIDEEITGYRGAVVDITELKRVETELSKSELRFRKLSELKRAMLESPEGMVVFALDKDYQYINFTLAHEQTMKAIWGVNIEIGSNMLDYISSKEDRFKAKKNFDEALKGEHLVLYEEYGDESRSRKTYEDRYSPIYSDDGEIVGIVVFVIDITARKQIEEKYQESELRLKREIEQFENLFETIPAKMYIKDKESRFVRLNVQMKDMLGNHREQHLGKTDHDFFDDIHADKARKDELEVMNQGEPKVAYEEREVWPNGKVTWAVSSKIPLRDTDGEVNGLLGISLDITQQKETEAELRKSEQRMKLAASMAKLGSYEWDLRYPDPLWDEEMHNIFGLNPVSKVNRNEHFSSVLHPDDVDKVNRKFAESMAPAKTVTSIHQSKFRIIVDGQTKFITSNARHFRNKTGEVTRIIGAIGDVTELMSTEEALRSSEERLKLATHAAKIGCFDWKVSDPQPYWDEQMHSIFGVSPDSGVNKIEYFDSILHPDDVDHVTGNRARVFAPNSKVNAINEGYRIIQGDKISHIEVDFIVIRDGIGEVARLIGTCKDVTERKHIEEELRMTNKELSEALEKARKSKELEKALKELKKTQTHLVQSEKMASVGILAGGIAHEINNPLNYILGGHMELKHFAEENLSDQLKEEIHPIIDMIEQGVSKATSIVRSLNRFNRQSDYIGESCDIHIILDNCLNMLHNQIKHDIIVNKNLTDQDPVIMGNEGELHQVLLNILTNAIQAIEEEGDIRIETKRGSKNFKINISDTGEGISEENLEKVLDPFFTTKAPGAGTGLGMSIAYSIIKKHGGSIKYESKRGKGTTAYLTLPLKQEIID